RTRHTMRLRHTMRSALRSKIMPLDRAGEALADGTTDDVDDLADLETGHIKFVTDLDFAAFRLGLFVTRIARDNRPILVDRQAQLPQAASGLDPGLLEVARGGRGNTRRPART